MADGPILTPEQAQSLQDLGQLSPDTAGQFTVPVEEQVVPQEVVGQETVMAPQPVDPAQEVLDATTQGIPVLEESQVMDAPPVEESKVPQSQEEVEEGLTPQQRFEKIKLELQAVGPAGFGREVSDEQVLAEMERRDQEKVEDTLAVQQELDDRLLRRKALLEKAAANGIQISRDEELDSILEQQAAEAAAPTEQEIEQAAEPIKEKVAEAKATERVLQQQKEQVQQKIKAANEEIAREDERVSSIDPERYIKNMSTGDRVLGSIALMLGGFSSGVTGGKNPALEMLNKSIDKDIEAQKMDIQQAAAHRQHVLKVARLKLEQEAGKVDNALKRTKIASMINDMQSAEQQLQQQRLKAKLIASGKEIDPNLLNEKERKRAVILPGGGTRLATNEKAATEVRAMNRESAPALKAIERIKKLVPEMNRFNPADPRRAALNTELTALVGQLRIPFTGPGVLTDTEYKRLKSAIGDPAKILAFPSVELAKIQAVEDKLKSDMETQYFLSGIPLEKNADDISNMRMLKFLKKNNKGVPDLDLIKALKARGKWRE